MIVKLLSEHHLEFLNLKGGCRSSFVSTYVKMPNCWKAHVLAQLLLMHVRNKGDDHSAHSHTPVSVITNM